MSSLWAISASTGSQDTGSGSVVMLDRKKPHPLGSFSIEKDADLLSVQTVWGFFLSSMLSFFISDYMLIYDFLSEFKLNITA